MRFSVIQPGQESYFAADECDTDLVLWSNAVTSDSSLTSTGNAVQDLGALFSNRAPRDGRKLKRNGSRVRGFALALTAPKCFSILEVGGHVPELHAVVRDAVMDCLKLAAAISAPAGLQADPLRPCRLVAFASCQRLNAADQPHRHVHLGVLSLADNPDRQRYTGVDLSHVLRAGEVFQALFQHRLACGMACAGYSVRRDDRSFEVEGLQEDLLRRFSCGRWVENGRQRPSKPNPRPAERFEEIRRGWTLSENEGQTLASLRAVHAAKPPSQGPFRNHLYAAQRSLLRADFWVTTNALLVEGLRRSYGYRSADTNKLANELLGLNTNNGLNYFELGGRVCCSTAEGLGEEKAFFDLVQSSRMAERGWFGAKAAGGWWADLLRCDPRRVALIRGGFFDDESPASCQELLALRHAFRNNWLDPYLVEPREEMKVASNEPLLVERVDEWRSRRLANVMAAQLRAGGRVLLAGTTHPQNQSFWLNTLQQEVAIPVWREPRPEILRVDFEATPSAHPALRIEADTNSTLAAAARIDLRQPGAVLLCTPAQVGPMTDQLRAHLVIARGGKRIKKRALQQVEREAHVADIIMFPRRIAHFHAHEPLTVLEVQGGRLKVRLAHVPLNDIVSAQFHGKFEVFEVKEKDLSRLERIRFTRAMRGLNGVRFRAGQHAIAVSVKADGSAILGDGRILPADAGGWEYDYCASVDGPSWHVETVICDIRDLPRVAQAGWLAGARRLVVCGVSQEVAVESLRAALPELFARKRPEVLPGTDEMALDLGRGADLSEKQELPEIEPLPAPPAEPVQSGTIANGPGFSEFDL